MIARYDLLIVGGSFAGLAAARTAALRGLKTAVIDAKPEPGARIRTTGIVVKEACDDCDLPAQLMRKVRGVRLYAPDDRYLDLSAPGYFFQATDTAGVLRWMAEEASRAGAASSLWPQIRTARSTHERGIALPDLGLHTRFLIGADGARSRVAERFGLGRNKRFLAGMEIECDTAGRSRSALPALLRRQPHRAGLYRLGRARSRHDADRRGRHPARKARSRRCCSSG